MKVYATKPFDRFCGKAGISDESLRIGTAEIERGLIDANLGGGVIKKRVARAGRGKSAGYRVLLAFRFGRRAVFIFGFAKGVRDNVSASELARLKEEKSLRAGALREVEYGEEDREKAHRPEGK